MRNKIAVARRVTIEDKGMRMELTPAGSSRGKHRKRYALLVLGTYTDEELKHLDIEEVMAELGWVREGAQDSRRTLRGGGSRGGS